ncbi:hypothetical protein OH76DRAFT_1398168 [Lentinus brumalis]|uniref:F-box domain-containing protein n=1 Tax=Lentinus brumalis TaxID=2498619 RepID=A0A371DQF2_9APHY|nr:hypothetical protein OH76DRAFT_1398168 [Polyporus brumalis]
MPPTTSASASFPVELLQLICEAADHSTLYSIALSDRTFNELATPALYSTIDLQLFHAIYACVRTLALPPGKTSFKRDLASLVKTISLHDTSYDVANASTLERKQRDVARRRLAHAVPRMRGLRSFICRMCIYLTAGTFTTLANGTLPFVHSIDIDVDLPRVALEDGDGVMMPFAVTDRGLKTLRLETRSSFVSHKYEAFIHALLVASRHTLQSFSLPYGAESGLRSTWPSTPSFPALRELCVPPNLLSQPAFQGTSSIRALVIPRSWSSAQIAPTAFPNLEEVTCSPHELVALLPERAQHRRPIRAVTLEDVQYGVPRFHAMAEHLGIQGWHLVARPALRALRFSGARLARLSFLVSELSVPFLEDLLPLFEELEYLYILLQVRTGEHGYGLNEVSALAPLLERMPRLHTFLLCDKMPVVPGSGMAETRVDGGPHEFARNEDDQRHALAAYDRHSSSLRRAAFTSDFEWEKRGDGWHRRGHVVAEREIDSDGEDEAEE